MSDARDLFEEAWTTIRDTLGEVQEGTEPADDDRALFVAIDGTEHPVPVLFVEDYVLEEPDVDVGVEAVGPMLEVRQSELPEPAREGSVFKVAGGEYSVRAILPTGYSWSRMLLQKAAS